jgi:hypothetical protein
MRDPRVPLLLVLLLASVPAAAARRGAPAKPEPAPTPAVEPPPELALLTPGSHPAWIMDFQTPARAGELFARWTRAIRADPQWFAAYSKAHPQKGVPLPWHAKMGLSETEYAEMLELSQQTRMTRIGRATLTVTREGASRLALHGGVTLPDLTGVALDVTADSIVTPYGRLEGSQPVAVTDPDSPTGPWSGRSWRLDTVDPATRQGVVVRFELGRLADGTAMLHYDAKRIVKGAVQNRAYHLVTFAGAAP